METTTAKEPAKKPAWTAEEEARIAHFQETEGLGRMAAIRKMKTEAAGKKEVIGNRVTVYEAGVSGGVAAKPARKRAPKVSKPKAERKPKRKAGASMEEHLSPQKLAHIDKLVRECVGKGRAIECVFKSSLSEKYGRYIWFGVSDGNVLSVNPDKMETRWLDADSRSVKAWQKMQAKAIKREEKLAAKAEKEEEKAAKAKSAK